MGRIKIVKVSVLLKVIYRFNSTPLKIPISLRNKINDSKLYSVVNSMF